MTNTNTNTNTACNTNSNNTTESSAPTTTSEIEKALAAVKAAVLAKKAEGGEPKESKRPRLSDEEKAARAEKIAQERAEKKAAKEEKKAQTQAQKDAEKAEKAAAREAKKAAKAEKPAKVPHLAKVTKEAEKLPELDDTMQAIVDEVTEMSAPDMSAVIAHLVYKLRLKQTIASNDITHEVGDTVKITSGNADVLGLIGVVSEVHRIRALVQVPGIEKPIYTFTADLEPCEIGDTESECVDSEAV
jgi:flagellar biosynthesis GTPase FlhF